MRTWEFDRYDWGKLDAANDACDVPRALDALSSASNEDEASVAYWRIDNNVVVQGSIRGAAPATAACLITLLPICTKPARQKIVELLEQLSTEGFTTLDSLQVEVFHEIVRAYGYYASLLQYGDDIEASMCVDLLLYCARHDGGLRSRTRYFLERMAEQGRGPAELRDYATARLRFESEAWLQIS